MSVTAVPIPPIRRGVLGLLWLGLAAAVAVAVWLAVIGAAPVVALKGTNDQFLAYNRTRPEVTETASGLQYQVLKKGEGTKTPSVDDIAGIQFIGRLRDGTEFQRSQNFTPISIRNGAIPGIAEGLKLMPKGSVYRFWIKPELGYGEKTPDPNKIPPDALLVFDVQMLEFISEAQYQQIQLQQQMQQGALGGAGAPGAPAAPPPPAN